MLWLAGCLDCSCMSLYYSSWSEQFFYMSRNNHFVTNKVESILFRISQEKSLPSSKYLDNHLTCKALKVPQMILLSWTKIIREFCNMPGYWTEYVLPDYRHISCKLQKKNLKNQMTGRDCGKQLKDNNLGNRPKIRVEIAQCQWS